MDAKFLVPYETARMLREKGYTAETDYYYDNQTREVKPVHQLREGYKVDFLHMLTTYYTPAPTYHEVLDWMEEKGYYIFPHFDDTFENGENAWYSYIRINDLQHDKFTDYHPTREDALNAAIAEALKLL